ncbi:MAG: hypothetical protein ACRD2O_02790, partial [Terriglobia bacterium]
MEPKQVRWGRAVSLVLGMVLAWSVFIPHAVAQTNPGLPVNQPAGLKLPIAQPAAPNAATKARVIETYGKLPLRFEANQGQTDAQVKFLARGSGYTLFLTGDEAVLSLREPSPPTPLPQAGEGRMTPRRTGPLLPGEGGPGKQGFPPGRVRGVKAEGRYEGRNSKIGARHLPLVTGHSPKAAQAIVRMKLVGANAKAAVTGLAELPGRSNYFIGNDPKKWRTNVPNYAQVRYQSVYPGVDLVYYGNQG